MVSTHHKDCIPIKNHKKYLITIPELIETQKLINSELNSSKTQ